MRCYNTLLWDVQSLIQSVCMFINTKHSKETLQWKLINALSQEHEVPHTPQCGDLLQTLTWNGTLKI